jgi:hypothetical protein
MTGQDKRRMYFHSRLRFTHKKKEFNYHAAPLWGEDKRLSTVAVEEEGADFGDWVEMVGLQLGSNDEVYGQSPV